MFPCDFGRQKSPQPLALTKKGGNSVYRRINTQGDLRHHDYQANAVAPAPENSNQVCAIGTNRGVVRWVADGYRAWLTPRSPPQPKQRNPYTDIFSLDFQAQHADVLLFGGRPGRMWIGDHRQPPDRWGVVATPSPITHIRSVNEHQVLVAGLRDKLSVYDLRFMKKGNNDDDNNRRGNRGKRSRNRSSRKSSRNDDDDNNNTSANAALPILTFPQYRNRAHVDIGLALDAASGVVAAAHDDGRVVLYSIRSGARLRCGGGGGGGGGVDGIHSPRGPVQAVQFQMFPRDVHPTLFVGVQSSICAYSFGSLQSDDEA